MNVLVENFPTQVKVNNIIYDINYDYKTCIKIIMAYEDDELLEYEKCEIILTLFYKKLPPFEDYEEALRIVTKFLDCGEINNQDLEKKKRVYSFKKDGKYIYTAMLDSHQIDLQTQNIHWWQFMYLFLDLNKNSMFSNIVQLRSKKNEGKLSKEEKSVFFTMRDILDLDYTEEQSLEEQEFMQLLNGGD